MATKLLTEKFSEPINGAAVASIDISAGDGNLTIDRLSGGESVLASGMLQYFEKQAPARSLESNGGKVTLKLKGDPSGQPWFRFPWSACNGATEWQIHLNPTVPSDITAHSSGGNIRLDLTGMTVNRVSVETGGGNVDLILPEGAEMLSVSARTGAGNVVVFIPASAAACIHATTGLGKVIADPRFSQIDKTKYQSSNFDLAANKIELTLHSGAGNVILNTM